MLRKATFLTTAAVLALAGCSERDAVLPGERLDVRNVLVTRAGTTPEQGENTSRPLALSASKTNSAWAQAHVSPHARISHPALARDLSEAWAVNIGAGDSRRKRLNADPVVAGGRIFTIDADNRVSATSSDGTPLWNFDLTPLREKASQGQGGGLALGDGRLYVSSGFGTLSALDPASGTEVWTQRLGNTATGAPSYRDGLVYLVSGDTTGWAIEADTGRVRWQVDLPSDVSNVAGAPAPAVSDKYVSFAFGTGTVQTVFRQGGLRVWSADILGRRNGVTLAGITDVTGDPVVAGDMLFAGNHSGRTVGFSLFDGERKWTARMGALGAIWAAGDSVFLVSDLNQLVRLDAATGEQIWATDLPGYVPRRRPNKRRDSAYANLGPIMAGGRLIVASSDGQIRSFDPKDGTLLSSIEIPGGATTRPIVANGVLYVVSGKGRLHAFR